MAALTVIGLAVGAASGVAQLNAASRQARINRQAIADQQLLSKDRLEILQRNRDFAKEWSRVQATQELLVINEQEKQAFQDIMEQELQQRMAITQSKMERAGLQTQIAQVRNELLSALAAANAETNTANANAFAQSGEMAQEASGAASGMRTRDAAAGVSNSMSADVRQAQIARSVDAQNQQIVEGVRDNMATSAINTENARRAAELQERLGMLSVAAADSNIRAAEESLNVSVPFARKQVRMTTRRNRIATRAAQFSNEAAMDAQYNSQRAQEAAQQLALAVQSRQQRSPGVLSYLSLGANVASQAYQAGLFSRGIGGVTPTAPTVPSQNPSQMPNAVQGGLGITNNFMKSMGIAEAGRRAVTRRPFMMYTDVTGNIYG